ncbi:MAG: hypothetical protein IH886_00980 [Nitrospinae bacterium]|nr:hypothetical protein [Nitrospinota bacterium]
MPQNYRVRIKSPSIEIEVESTDKAYIDEKIKEYLKNNLDSKGEVGKKKTFSEKESGGKPLSIQEFVKKIKPVKDTEYILGATYFYEKFAGMNDVKVKDIGKAFKDLKYKHSNHGVPISRAKKQGYLMDGNSKGGFVLTNSGEAWVEERVEANAKES